MAKIYQIKIRTNEISLAASLVSKLANVRRMLVARQQEMAKEKGFIMDGRDIGTVVLTDAEVKIYMTATPMARAKLDMIRILLRIFRLEVSKK